MPKKPVLNVALVGYAFMGRAHSNAYQQVNKFFPDCPFEVRRKVLIARSPKPLAAAAATWGWEEWSTDFDAVLRRDDIDLVDITTPPNGHFALARKALKAGKYVLCEKPLAMNTAQARELAALAKQLKTKTGLWHCYRRSPSASTAAQLIADGKIGAVRHVRALYLQDWLVDPTVAPGWRTTKKICGSGSHGDLNAHLIDMTRFMTGLEFDAVVGLDKTFIKRRPSPTGKGTVPVDVDDAFLFLARLSNGAVASYEATRFAPGHKNYNWIEINGEKGSIRWNFERMNELEFFTFDEDPSVQGFHDIMCMDSAGHPYAGNYWPNGHLVGYEQCFTNTLYDYLVSLKSGPAFRPDFADGVAVQEVIDAGLASVKQRGWVTIKRSQKFSRSAMAKRAKVVQRNAGL
jgi:predicted dehydrogenase